MLRRRLSHQAVLIAILLYSGRSSHSKSDRELDRRETLGL